MITEALAFAFMFVIGAFISLYAYHCGRNNTNPTPAIHIPKLIQRNSSNGQTTDQAVKVPSRGSI